MLNSKITNGILIATGFLASLSVIPTIVLGNSVIQSAEAQTEATTSSPSTHRTFHAEGVVGNLNLAPTTLESIPPPEAIAGSVSGGNWSLDVVDGEVQNFTLTLMSVDANGKNFQKRELRDLTNVQPGAVIPTIENATAGTSSSTGNNNTSQGIVLDGNSTSFTGNVIGVSESGTDARLSVIFNLVNGNLINVYLQIAAEPLLESDRLPIFGITTSLTDENGNSLLEGRT
jgi:hypothetical protein